MIAAVRPRDAVLAMREYHPPLAGRTGLLLDFNENTWAPSAAVVNVLHSLAAEKLTAYPEREPVEQAVAEALGLEPSQVLLTNGVDEGIHLVCETFLEPQHSVIVPVPTFAMYATFAQSTGATVREVQAGADFAFPFEQILRAIDATTRLIAFAAPNNPTGAVANREQILALADAAPEAIVLVDEAYFHFHGETVLDCIGSYPNLIVARTFSKAYGLAGLRVGLLAAEEQTLRWVRKVASPYNVNALALACLPAAIADTRHLRWYCEQAIAGREMLERALDNAGIPRWTSHANFVLARIGARHAELVTRMRERGILVRDRSSDPGCDGCVRITAGIPEQMKRAIGALRDVLSEMNWHPAEAR